MPRRNLDGRFRNNNVPKSTPNSILIARWVECEVLALSLLGRGLAEIAKRVGAVGHGSQIAVSPLPQGIAFPDRYKISPQACGKALTRALEREPRIRVREFAQIWMKRSEELYFALQQAIRGGDVKAITAARGVLALQLKFVGPESMKLSFSAAREPDQEISSGVVGLFRGAIQVLADAGFDVPGCRMIPLEPEPRAIETTAEPSESMKGEPV
jgi:hypothetical protein